MKSVVLSKSEKTDIAHRLRLSYSNQVKLLNDQLYDMVNPYVDRFITHPKRLWVCINEKTKVYLQQLENLVQGNDQLRVQPTQFGVDLCLQFDEPELRIKRRYELMHLCPAIRSYMTLNQKVTYEEVFDNDADLIRQVRTLTQQISDLEQECRNAMVECNRLLEVCNSTRQLEEAWPMASNFYPPEVFEKMRKKAKPKTAKQKAQEDDIDLETLNRFTAKAAFFDKE